MSAPDRHAQADAAFHDETAHVYEQTLEPHFRAYRSLTSDRWLDELPRLTDGRHALDLGCGTGAMTVWLAERGYDVRGIDHSQGMLDIARRKVEQLGLEDRVELSVGDIRELPWDDETFDVVACQGVLHHLDDMSGCLAEVARVLKAGGVFYIAEPCEGSTPALAAIEGLARLKGRALRGGRGEASGAQPAHVDEHEEAPIEVATLAAILDRLGLSHDETYWSRFPGVHRLSSVRLQRALIRGLSAPWSRRAGNLVIVRGRKP